MAIKRYTRMEYGSPDEMVFGEARYPVSYGLGQTVGAGVVVPEINFAPGRARRRVLSPSGGSTSTT